MFPPSLLNATGGYISRLKASFVTVMERHPYIMEALVILPDQIHCLWWMPPPSDSNYSIRWRLIKGYFSNGFNDPVNKRGEKQTWQRRFREHLLEDDEDWRRHMDYIHYTPVKHGYVENPGDWPHRSFRQATKDGLYAPDWGVEEPGSISRMDVE